MIIKRKKNIKEKESNHLTSSFPVTKKSHPRVKVLLKNKYTRLHTNKGPTKRLNKEVQ
jgi:hypothetical protein